jgi:polysaccharide biosynthesis transport protein
MDIRHRLRLIRSWARWIIAGTLIAAVAAYLISGVLPKVYEADARLVVGQALSSNNPDPNQFATAQQLSAAYVALAGDRPVLEAVIKRLNLNTSVDEFVDLVSVDAVRELPFIDIVGRSDSPEQAAAIANAMAAELVALSPTLSGSQGQLAEFVDAQMRAIEAQITGVREEYDRLLALTSRTATQDLRLEVLVQRLVALQGTYAQLLQFTNGTQANKIAIVQPAVVPLAPASPRPLFNVAIAASLAFLLSLGAAFLWERLDDRIKSPEDLEAATGLAMIGLVAQMPGDKSRKAFYRLASLLYPRSPAAEAFRTIRTNIEFAALDRGLRTIVVTSSLPTEGKTVVASNLAVAFAQAGRRTILVDADLRRPGVHTIFGLPNEQGLTDLVRTDSVSIEDVAQQTEAPNLTVITAGTIPANPAELLGSRRMAAILERLKESADIVIFDTPPVTAVTDAAVTAAKADATIMVIQSHRASRRIVAQGLEALTKVNARIAGAVLNNVPGHVATPYYGRNQGDARSGIDSQPIDMPIPARMASDAPMEARQADNEAIEPTAKKVPRSRARARPRTPTPTPPRPASDPGANR